MKDIDKIICQSDNPFESQLTPGNFWYEQPDSALMVDSIHQEVLNRVKSILTQMNQNSASRTLIISGESGSGKSYLLGRIKRTLNQKAFFAYISPWPDSKYIWRHTLRQTIDSLVCKPEGKKDSQLILWIKSLSAFKERGIIKWMLGERGLFINNLRATYPSKINNAREFFGVLYDLTNPELYPLACDWLRGDNLDEDELKKLNVKQSIDSEHTAKNILSNFGRIAADTQPIVLCFDQLDNIPSLDHDFLDLQSLFNINTTIHNEYYKNFLVIISIITNTWKQNKSRIQSSDLARVRQNDLLSLKAINLEQAEALWKMRLHEIHNKVTSISNSSIYPLTREQLQSNFPRGKVLPRNTLIVGSNLFEEYKQRLIKQVDLSESEARVSDQAKPATLSDRNLQDTRPNIRLNTKSNHQREEKLQLPRTKPKLNYKQSETDKYLASFKSVWQTEYRKIQSKITKINLIAEPELIKMLQEVLAALEIAEIEPELLSGKYSVNSFSYRIPRKNKIGIFWTENRNKLGFCNAMKACEKVFKSNSIESLYLLRVSSVGNNKHKGYRIYKTIFNNSFHHHLKPNLTDIHYLATYHQLVNAAKGNELLISGKIVSFKRLKFLICQSEIMSQCSLLQDLGIVMKQKIAPNLQKIQDFLLAKIKNQQLIEKQSLIDLVISSCEEQVSPKNIDHSLQKLIQENQINIVNPQAKVEEQIICLIPH